MAEEEFDAVTRLLDIGKIRLFIWPWNAHTRLVQLLDRIRKQYAHASPPTDAQE